MNISKKFLQKGIVLALITATISGFSVFYNKIVLIQGLDPLIFNIIKNGGVAILLSLFIFQPSKIANFKKEISISWRKMLLIGAVGGSIPFILFFEGLKLIPALQAQLLNKTLFVWVALLAVIMLKEKLGTKQVAGFIIILYANFFIGGFKSFDLTTGHFLVITATLLWSLEVILVKKFLKNSDASVYAWARMTFGTLFLLFIAIIQNKLFLITTIPATHLLPILGSIMFLTGYVTSFYKALKHAPATIVTSILILATPITNILSMIFISKNPQPIDPTSILILILGVILIVNFKSKTNQIPSTVTKSAK